MATPTMGYSAAIELETISRPMSFKELPSSSNSKDPSIFQLEPDSSQLHTHDGSDERPVERKPAHRSLSFLQFSAVCWVKMLGGWNDGTSGPLIPRLQEHYHVNFIVVSLIFIMACIGFLTGAAINVPLTDKYGFGKVVFGASLCQVIAYSVMSAGVPFPAYLIMFTINGIGMSLQDAQAVTYTANLKSRPETKMMLVQAAYGAGAFSAPLCATHFSTAHHWSFHYLVSLGLALINSTALLLIFRGADLDTSLEKIGIPRVENSDQQSSSKMKQIMKSKTVHLLAIFILFYVGAEVTIGGWIVTYIQQIRGGGPSSGYISSGFFGGLMVGRFALLWVSQKLGDKISMYLYTAIAVGLELIVWFVPSLVGGAVAVSFIGFVLGPMYPIVMTYAGRSIPRVILSGSIGWIAGLGQTGSAVLPFITGSVANTAGIKTLQPMVVGMLGAMIGLWVLVPQSARRTD
ncbi:MFS general substrate transporter [Cylindrobasidium torrendii FP15055 ss-10]|uniref:MFS general substrate transporter n=1 Tax=Cylindrobasidium torrendii FP15055 ss-10 TaxID=1314674 RepID=A0A0D7BNR2_9AGAR|nr:MFS general substrate transporter [Cylindrobasidium torrendii FP15055 ss-10]